MKRYSDKIAHYALSGLMLLALVVPGGRRRAAHADTVTYSGQRRQIRACVLVSSAMTDGNGNPYNSVPHLFYALENRTDYKPAGWEFVNPIASSTITPTIYNRWKARAVNDPAFTNGTLQSQLFKIGAPLTKNIGAYWEVNLDTLDDATLSQFDIVYMPFQGGRGNGNILFTVKERELLRHFADQGGTIWAENIGSYGFNASGGQFIVNLQTTASNGANQYIVNAYHPLVTYPFNISASEASLLGRYGSGAAFIAPGGGPVNPRAVVPIIQSGNLPGIYAGDIGAGHLVLSGVARVGTDINGLIQGADGSGSNGLNNTGAVSGTSFKSIPTYDLKFAYNLIGWTGTVPSAGANARRTGSTLETIGVGIAPKWSTFPVAPTNAGSGGVIFKNTTFFVDGNNVLHAYDINPGESLSFNDLLTDDGIPDFIYGTPYDEIWNVNLGKPGATRYSTPSVYSVYDSGAGATRDVVIVTNNQGITQAFDAFPRDNQGRLLPTTNKLFTVGLDTGSNAAIAGTSGPQLPVPAAVYSDGVLFAPVYRLPSGLPVNTLTGGWHVMAIDLLKSVQSGSTVAAFGNDSSVIPSIATNGVAALGDLTGPLSVGYVRDVGTGAIDELVYVPEAGLVPSGFSTTQPQPPYLQALWFRTRNEPLVYNGARNLWQPTGARANVPWYTDAPASGGVDLRPVIHVTHTNTVTGAVIDSHDIPYNTSDSVYGTPLVAWIGGAMQITGLNVPASGATDTYAVSADYAVDWPGVGVGTTGAALNAQDLLNIFQKRRFRLYTNNGGVVVAGATPMLPAVQGGAALGNSDSVLFSATSGLKDQIMVSGAVMPDRIYSATEQYGANNGGTNINTSVINWMFSPMYRGTFDTWTIPPRLVNNDNFRAKAGNGTGAPTGQFIGAPGTALLSSGNQPVNFQVVGQPIVSKGVVYVVANANFNGTFAANQNQNQRPFNATVILALKETIDGNIVPPAPIQVNSGLLTLQQPNFNVQGTASYLSLRQATDKTTGEFTADTTTDAAGNIYVTAFHVFNMQSVGGNDVMNASLPFYITDNTGTRHEITGKNGFGPLDNLLWMLVIPYSNPNAKVASNNTEPMLVQPGLQFLGGWASSGASAFGDTLYYNATYPVLDSTGNTLRVQGSIISIDLNAVNGDPSHRLVGSDGTARVRAANTMMDPLTGNAYNLAAGGTVVPLINPPLAATNTVVVGGAAGLAALDNQLTLIADADRLFQVDALGQAVWSMSSTVRSSVAGASLQNGGGISTTTVPISQPTVARRTAVNVYAVADPEHGRVMQLDQGGQVLSEIRGLNNGLQFLRPGDPITLNHPSDVDIKTEQGTGISITNRITGVTFSYSGAYVATHYFIADSGNSRAVEVVTAVDPVSGAPVTMTGSDGSSAAMLQQVVFVTRSGAEQNVNYHYRTIQQFKDPVSGLNLMILAIDNVKVNGEGTAGTVSSVGSGREAQGGALMIIQRYTTSNGKSTDGDVAAIVNNISIPNAVGTKIVRRQPISAPTYFREFDNIDPTVSLTAPIPRYLMADNNGCYVLAPRHVNADGTIDPNNAVPNDLVVEWMLSENDYYFLTGRHLHATSMQRLTQAERYIDANGNAHYAPHYLITNSYSGRDNVVEVFGLNQNLANVQDGQVHGEVFEIRGKDYYVHPDNSVSVYSADGNANDAIYNGYGAPSNGANGNQTYSLPNGYQRYVTTQATFGFLTANILQLNDQTLSAAGSSIVRMVPPETVPVTTDGNGNPVKLAIQRSIGSAGNATTSYLLQQPLFSERQY